jgi:ABC-type transport system involved in cytochrome bd biosynthesis fused ATPase/permease subunit
LSTILLTLRSLSAAAAGIALGRAVDSVVAGSSPAGMLAISGGFLAVAVAVSGLLPKVTLEAALAVEKDLRSRVLSAVLAMGPAPSRRSGEVVAMATTGVAAAGALAGVFLPQLLGGLLVPLLICGLVATIDVPTALVLLVVTPLVPLLLRMMEKRFSHVSARYRATADQLASRFLDGIQGMRTLHLLGRSADYGADLAAHSERLRGETMALLRVNQLALFVVDTVFTLGTVVAAATAAMWRLESGVITGGEALSLVILGTALIDPLTQIGRFFYVGAIGRAAARQIREFLDSAPSVHPTPGAPVAHGAIRLDGVSFAYEGSASVLEGVSLSIDPGQRVALIGRSGAGKSTLAGLVLGLIAPSEGVVRVGGRAVMVSQRPYVFHGTLASNLRLARPGADEDALWSCLEAADLVDFARGLEGGLSAGVGERGLDLSGGEAQRLAIARAILADAPIVVLDEPTSNVDLETEARIRRGLDRLTQGRTVLVIAHRRTTLGWVDRVVSVADGRLSELASMGGTAP